MALGQVALRNVGSSGSGVKPTSASAGGLFTTEPSRKPERLLFINSYVNIVMFIIIPFCITSCMLFISSLC